MYAISQTTFSNAFSWMKMFEFRHKFQWSLLLMVPWKIFQHWFRQWLGVVRAISHYLKRWWLVYRRIYAPLGLNELRLICKSIQFNSKQVEHKKFNQFNEQVNINPSQLLNHVIFSIVTEEMHIIIHVAPCFYNFTFFLSSSDRLQTSVFLNGAVCWKKCRNR